jgi:hypothetical protein
MATHNRRKILKTAGGIALVGSLAGCAGNNGGDGNETEGGNETGNGNETEDTNETTNESEDGATESEEMAEVRVAHLSPDAPNVDVYVDDELVLEDVAFGDVSDYLELPPGSYNVQITETGTEEAVFDESLEVEAAAYTVAAIGELAEENEPFGVEVFENDLSDPGENARIQGIHAAPDAPAVTITDEETGSALFEDLAFGESQSAEAPPGDYTLEVRPATAEDDSEPVATFDASVEAGTVYSAFAIGYLNPGDAPADEPFDLQIVEDRTADEMTSEGGMDGGNETMTENETA